HNAVIVMKTSPTSGGGGAGDTIAPTVPAGLSATPVLSTHVNLSWSPSSDNVGVSGYYVHLNDQILANVGNVTSYSQTGLTAGTTYNYRVSAYDAVPNHSAWTNVVSATTPVAGP